MEQRAREQLSEWLIGVRKIVVVGIGNPMRIDDAVGLSVVDRMQGRVSNKVELLRAETVPESFTANIRRANPSHILLIDAGQFGAEAGETRLVDSDCADGLSISTHSVPLKLLTRFLKESTNAKIALLAIQPRLVEFGEKMTPELYDAAADISQTLTQLLE